MEEPTTDFESLGLHIDLANTLPNALDDVTHICQEFSTQMNNAKCNKTSCLNTFNTSFMATFSYRMIVTQFSEHQWNKAICPAIRITCNAVAMANNFAHAVLFGPAKY